MDALTALGAVAVGTALVAAGDIPCSVGGCPCTASVSCPWCIGLFFVAYCDQVHRGMDWMEHIKHCAGVRAALERGGASLRRRAAASSRAVVAYAETVIAPRAPVASVKKRHNEN